MPLKVVGVAAGEAHTLALTGDGRVFTWGRGTFGRLGNRKEEDELSPVRVDFPDASSSKKSIDQGAPSENGERLKPKFVGISAGAYHSLALEEDGSVWSWGYNIYGQLGHGEENSSVPSLVEGFQGLVSPDSAVDGSKADLETTPLKVCSVAAGGMISLAIDSLGGMWMWGNCPQQGEDGVFCLLSCPSPIPVWDFHGHTVVKVACGNEHVVALVSAGERHIGGDLICYAWGNNNHGQLGLGHAESRSKPEIITAFNQECPWSIFEVSCGAFHSAMLTHRKSNGREVDCKCWTFGLGENGQLGRGTTMSTCLPEHVEGLPGDAVLISLDCGLFHTSVVSAAGDVWSWGMERGLGLCPDASFAGGDAGDALSPIKVHHTEGPVQVACGAAHTVLVADNGYKIWAWGRGRSGVLGRGQTMDSYVPCAVLWPPPDEDFKEEGIETKDGEAKKQVGRTLDVDQKLSATEEEIQILRTKLTLMERYASLLHVSIFRKQLDERKLPQLLQVSGVFDIGKELENLLDCANIEDLVRMEMFYTNMLANVKDKLLKRRIEEIVKETLHSLSTRRQPY